MIERWQHSGSAPVHATVLHGVVAAEEASIAVEAAGAPEASKPPPATTKRPPSRLAGRVAWLAAMVTVGVFLGLLVILGLKFIDGPVSSTQSKSLTKLQAAAVASPAVNTLSSMYVELKYPGVFDQMGRSKGGSHTLEAYVLSSRNHYTRQIAVDVGELASNNLEDDSSYKYRLITPDLYTRSKVTVAGEAGVVMVKADSGERTLFLPHKGKLLTVSLTSDNPAKDNLEEYLKTILESVRWRQ